MKRAWVLSTVVFVGCTATLDRHGVENVPGQEIWKTEIELKLGERALVDDGRLELTLVSVGVDQAELFVQKDSGARQETVRAGQEGSLQTPPYEIRLLSTIPDDSANLQVRRQWGEYR